MATALPDDILYMIMSFLREREDYATLYNCAVSSKCLAPLALSHLYRFVTSSRNPNACCKCLRDLFWDSYAWTWLYSWEWAPSYGWDIVHRDRCALHKQSLNVHRMQKSPGSDEEAEGQVAFVSEQELLVQRWCILWRSICLASMDQTMFPYHQYLRSLDLRDLENLLEDSRFNGKVEETFFQGSLSRFHHQTKILYSSTKNNARRRTYMKLDLHPILEDIGAVIVAKTHMLEQVCGKLTAGSFLKWLPNLSRLRRLELYNGEVLADGQIHKAIYDHCPHFEALSIFQWLGQESDHQLGSFLAGLRPNTLKDLTTISSCGVSTEVCQALNNHGLSIKKLQLNFGPDAVSALALLRSCTAVENLHLEIPATADLETTHKEVFLELIVWLGECHKLRDITLKEFKSAPAILTPILMSGDVYLNQISLNAARSLYSVKDSRNFHRALAHQKSLTILGLRGDGDDVVRDDIDAIVESVAQLTNLKTLELRGVADFFGDTEIIQTLSPLKALEEVYIGGWNVSDAVLDTVASLEHLRAINFVAVTMFTCTGLLNCIAKLGPNNNGLHMSIDNADPNTLMSEDEVALVREALATKVGGRVDYLPLRDPNNSEFENSDSD